MTKRSSLLKRVPRKPVAAVGIPAAIAAIAVAPARVALITVFVAVAVGLMFVGQVLVDVNRRLERMGKKLRGSRNVSAPGNRPKTIRWLESRLWNGFSATALDELASIGSDTSASPHVRSEAHSVIADWYDTVGATTAAYEHTHVARLTDPRKLDRRILPAPAQARKTTHVDVVIMSNFNLPGGTVSSSVAEIDAQTRAGLTTGLMHHPIYDWSVNRPLNPRLLQHVDGDTVRFLGPHERVTCDLLIIRAPKIAEHLMDDMPHIDAARTIFLVNQTPIRSYGVDDEPDEVWNIVQVHDNLAARFGEHVWYPIGPATRNALIEYHAAELNGVPLADEDWVNIIDVDTWRREGRREPDGRIRIGRHSRDYVGKWPETRELLTAVYPDALPYEVHVLGGASAATQIFGTRPHNWTVHPFDSIPVRDFIHGLDVYAYYSATGFAEAFGRAPLEALAAGVPTILPPHFKDVFGDAAIYAEPVDVRGQIDKLMSDDQLYAEHVEQAWEITRQQFGYEAHSRRLRGLGCS